MSEEARMFFQAGPLMWGTVRNCVMYARSKGYDVTMEESKGLLTRSFLIRGDKAAVKVLHEYLKQFET